MTDIQYYPSIEQFRNVIKSVRDYCRKNETPLPELLFNGTVKLHGTNAGIVLQNGEYTYLSHKRVICVGDDNYGFAAWMQDRVALLPIEEGCTLSTRGSIRALTTGKKCAGKSQSGNTDR